MHGDLFIGMWTIQRSGDIVVRMCGRWEKIVVDQRRCRRILKQVNRCVLPIFAFLRLNTTFSTLLMLKCMETCSLGCTLSKRSGDIVGRMCGRWEKIVEDQRRCRRILKQVKQCVLPIFAFLRLNTTFSTLLMLKCMETCSLGCTLSKDRVI